ncbi:MAG: ABC transporter [Gammaproteobacteria bacterium CG_4_10_14_0_8_um_filter_38_16]|nr:MAG: ABC transporter [Gammaproteobacteria bacterium CG_4_10_14_0_8_um_filter_38_16]PJA03362.1 MAG: ABC transporter [Gammaproteobacteria bacterium CG_4_10_14_0_2_um_filter_38_22]PJB11502.1 MAG: ABC transporter [Gammaproteobacteria bacterium CG_4_9_14_3_um_filter_38_9]
MKKTAKWILSSLAISAMLLSTGCAKKPDPTANDPLEGYNRVMFAFNMDVDHLVFRPVATVYNTVTPSFVQTGVTNVFANIDEIPSFPNDFMQGQFKFMLVDLWRFAINSTLGVGGLFDVAKRMGLPPHVATFGGTLRKWTGKTSPYFIMPFLGPSTIFNTTGYFADYYMTPWPYLKDQNINYIAHAVKLVNIRASLLPADKMVDTAFDPYIFVRDAYMQRQAARAKGEDVDHGNTAHDLTSPAN